MTGQPTACIACLVLCLAIRAPTAFAQTPPIEPPRRTDAGDVPYPSSGSGRSAVLLELVVDRDGNVADVRVVDGTDPFAAMARDAAKSWHFAPAMRGGEPVQARIRVRVDFAPPPRTTPPIAPTVSPPPAESPPSHVEEVTVYGVRPEPGRQEMSGNEVRQMPGSFGDAFRAIEALPGVIPLLSGLPYFLVRGAPPGNTGFFIDGVRVPALFHLGVGAAVIHPALVDRVDLYPGGYPARFGRFTGGILSGETLQLPNRPHAEAAVRLIDAGALVTTPFAEGRGDVLASGRYGYPGPLVSLFAPDTGLAYWDYQTHTRWRTGDRDELGAFIFGSYDSVSQRNTRTGRMAELLGIQFHRADLRWDRRSSETGVLRVALTLGYERSATSDLSQFGGTSFVESGTFGLRTEWSERATHDADVRIGADAVLSPYRVRIPSGSSVSGLSSSSLGSGTADLVQTDVDSAVYGELTWRAAPRVEMRPGLRVDTFTSRSPRGGPLATSGVTSVGAIDPRLAARWQITPTVASLVALGVAHQASNIPLPGPGLQFSQLSRGLQSAYQYSAGAEVKLPAEFMATGNVFLHDYTGLADYLETCPAGQSTCTFDGRAIGFEFLVRRSLTKRVTGWLSYTLSRVERDAYYTSPQGPFVGPSQPGAVRGFQPLSQGGLIRRLSEFDRTHVANLVLAADLGARWRAGMRLVAYSGLPYSTSTGSVGPPDARGPAFFRVDVRVEKRWQALGGTMAVVLEWLNALLSKETFGTTCSPSFGSFGRVSSQCTPTQVGPITFPSIGLEASW
jgi:TonB family protein